MGCEQCKALDRAAEHARREYLNARGLLEDLAGSMDVGQASQARRLVENARLHHEAARAKLEQHQQDFHGTVS